MFRSSLPIGRVMEDYFGLPPVILCYKLNGQWLSSTRGNCAPSSCVTWKVNWRSSKSATRTSRTSDIAFSDRSSAKAA